MAIPRRGPRTQSHDEKAIVTRYDESKGEYWAEIDLPSERIRLLRRHHAGSAGPTWFLVNPLPSGGHTISSLPARRLDPTLLTALAREADGYHQGACQRCVARPPPAKAVAPTRSLAAVPRWNREALRYLVTHRFGWQLTRGTEPSDAINSTPVQLAISDLTPTSELCIEIYTREPPPAIDIRVGGARAREIQRDDASRGYKVYTRTLNPPMDARRIGDAIEVTANLPLGEITVARIPAPPIRRATGPQKRFDYRRVRDLDTLDLPQVAHASKKGAIIAGHFHDAALSLLFERLHEEARDNIQRNEDDSDVRQRLVCLFRILYETYLFNSDYGQSLEISKWVDAARRHKRKLEAPYEVLKHEYELAIGRSHYYYHNARVEARNGHKRISLSDVRREEQRRETFRTTCARCKKTSPSGFAEGLCENCRNEITGTNIPE